MVSQDDAPENSERTGRGPRKKKETRRRIFVEPLISANPLAHGMDARVRRPDPYDPAVLERQVRAYDLRVAGYPNHVIANMLETDRHTVARDLQMETIRRREINQDQREDLIDLSLERYQREIRRLNTSATRSEAQAEKLIAEAHLRTKADHAERVDLLRIAAINRQNASADSRSIIAAQVRIDMLKGLLAPLKIELEDTLAISVQVALDVFASMTLEERAALRAKKKEMLKNVTPLG